MATGLQLSHANVLDEAVKNGLQSFVLPKTLVATNAVGTPVAGYFYSPILNRGSITDITSDLRVSFGVERIQVGAGAEIPGESGPLNQRVWAMPNESRVRFIGEWSFIYDTFATKKFKARCAAASTTVPCYVEVQFYGTGLNLLMLADSAARTGISCSIDQASYGSELLIFSAPAAALANKNHYPNQILSIASKLSLGLHTVIIKLTSPQDIYGLEVLNQQVTALTINPGTAYISGLKVVSNGGALSYGNNVTGTKGGRQLVYLNNDGSISNLFQAVDTTVNYLTNTTHANEEIAKIYSPTDFGYKGVPLNGIADFSTLGTTTSSVAYTLPDGTTTLYTNGSQISSPAAGLPTGIVISTTAGNWIELTFVGSGIDLVHFTSAAGMDTHTVTIDGVSVGNLPQSLTPVSTKLASGLPYGTHVLKITRSAVAGSGCWISAFKVYQPKKPSLPIDAMELADYNVLANYVANTTASDAYISTGVIRKAAPREAIYYSGLIYSAAINTTANSTTITTTTTTKILTNSAITGPGIPTGAYVVSGSGTTYTLSAAATATATGISANFYTPITPSPWNGVASLGSSVTGYSVQSPTGSAIGAQATLYFFGTGVELRFYQQGASASTTFSIDGSSNFATMTNGYGTSGITTSIYGPNGNGLSLNTSTGIVTGDSVNYSCGISFSNLPLGFHSVTITKNSSTLLQIESFDVITPVYSAKITSPYSSNADQPVGSNSLSDNRASTLTKTPFPQVTESAGIVTVPAGIAGLQVPGTVESTAGGFKFPDGSVQQHAGKVINSWFAMTNSTAQNINSTTPQIITGLSITLTPASVNSKFLIAAVVNGSLTYVCSSLIYRNGSAILAQGSNSSVTGANITSFYNDNITSVMRTHVINYIDVPGTTGTVTYDIRHTSSWGGSATSTYVNNRQSNDMACPCTLMIMEFEN